MNICNLHCHSFDSSMLTDAQVAIDCGANEGDFARWLSENTFAQVYSFEPDPRLYAKLPKLDRVEWIESAVGGQSGPLVLGLGKVHCSSTVYRESAGQKTVTVNCITLPEFCNARGIKEVDFLKLDIEGAELGVLESCSDDFLISIKQITVEFHDFLNADDVPRIEAIIARMRKLNFYFMQFSYNTRGDCLFLNQRHVQLSAVAKLKLSLLGKYLPGLKRIASRALHFTKRR